MRLCPPVIAMSGTNPEGCKPGPQFLVDALPPDHVFPRIGRQGMRQLFDRNGLMALVSPQQSRWAPGPFISGRWLWSLARFPNTHCAHDSHDIPQLHLRELRPKPGVGPVAGIG